MENFANILSNIFSPECYTDIFVEQNFSPECVKLVISKGLSYGIIAGSLAVKVPQILKLIASKSGKGLSLTSLYIEILALSFFGYYCWKQGVVMTNWLDSIFITIQNWILVLLIFSYERKPIWRLGLVFTAWSSLLYAFSTGLIPWSFIQAVETPPYSYIWLSARVSQIIENFRAGSTGQLSLITVIMILGGASARVFTFYAEDASQTGLMIQFASSASLAAVLFIQILWYWSSGDKKSKKE